ncbi:DUF3311 domain-containing protein [Aneurinibacillus aneurinilyticus]|uniref:DUF3311 domain-containing protein n=1 Tax=Aneurinibacillus aneurinilyticus TaxID=1391 RepID=UPI002E20A9DE|nr:DUF3311 domain-containing protein [Aneurinibacillus aneurinilyticus]
MKQIHLLGLIPFIGMLGGLPFANKVTPYILGMPFLLFWIVLWVILSLVVMAIINFIDPANQGGGIQ